MSEVDNSQTSTHGCPSTPSDTVSDPHINGHLVSTGIHKIDRKHYLFIHRSLAALGDHECDSYSYDIDGRAIQSVLRGSSTYFTVEEHGWFGDVEIFRQVCANHPIANGQPFDNWRDSLLAFLDSRYSGGLWTRMN
ncbi:hypothetical protein K491DRAFT_608635 [Lophiostoma macrostomum CBS 122681]|uniref:Uncharacterized protein n=1 Tax=Lophiostoma macrostomum CBS 122681 TaxID=1314788 RepID=A0A6A6SRW8_9PLEO|nr:hypothetical protein K491DRAFT_608635 [Lophiostoma macrostomum CBS 122681]